MELYKFQEEDVEKLAAIQHALIASETGTGKTHEAIAIEDEWYDPKSNKPTLVVCPTNVRESWQSKYGTQMPGTRAVIMGRKPSDRASFVKLLKSEPDTVGIMHWDALRLMPELRGIEFHAVIADEVHRISNRRSQASHALKMLQTDHKLGLSATASGDKPVGLWSVLNWLYPRQYSSYWRFFNTFVESEIVYPQGFRRAKGPKNLEQLHFELDRFYVRHLKKEQCCAHHPQGVMPWLADVTFDTIWVDLSPQQRRLYDGMRKEMIAWVGEHEDSPLIASAVVAQMTRLSQFALASASLDGGRVQLEEPSSKLDALVELVEDHPDKPYVVFSGSKQICYLAQKRLTSHKITSTVFSGDTPQAERDSIVRDFTGGRYQVLLATIESIGEGVDGLQEACDTMVFLDRSWKTIRNQQAIGRLDRDGQPTTEGWKINVIDIVARNTLDLGRLTRLEQKWTWIKQLLDRPQAFQEEL